MSYAVSVLDFEQCCKVVIAYDVPDHPRPFAVQYATRAEALTSCMAADAARHLAIFWMILLSSAYEEIEHATHNFPQPYLEYANALQTCAYNWRSSACYSRVLPYAFCLRRARPRPNTQYHKKTCRFRKRTVYMCIHVSSSTTVAATLAHFSQW